MNTLVLELLDGSCVQRIEGVLSLVAEDVSGQFGIQPRHEALVTVLLPGLVRYRCDAMTWQYLACAEGVLVCRNNTICIVSAHFLLAPRDELLALRLEAVRAEEHEARVIDRESRTELERTLMKRLRELSEAGPT